MNETFLKMKRQHHNCSFFIYYFLVEPDFGKVASNFVPQEISRKDINSKSWANKMFYIFRAKKCVRWWNFEKFVCFFIVGDEMLFLRLLLDRMHFIFIKRIFMALKFTCFYV